MSYLSIRKPVNDRIVQAARDSSNEIIGLLIGRLEKDTIIVEEAVTGEFSGEPTRVQLLPSTLAKIADDIIAGRIKGNIIGWYHSHPTGGLFFSETDVETQKIFQQFSRATIGMVVDGQTGQVGFFRVDREGNPYRIPNENVRTSKVGPLPLPIRRQPTRLPSFAPVNKLLTQKIVLSGVLIALVVAIALVGVIVYHTSTSSTQTPATISHTPITTVNVGQPIVVIANSTGTFQKVMLFYESADKTSFTSTVMDSPNTGEYQYSIPGNQVAGTVTYYITASNPNGVQVSTSIYHIQVADFLPEGPNETLTLYRNSTTPVISQIVLKPINGFDQQLTISASTPPGISAILPPNAQAGSSIQVSLTSSASASNGTFPVIISATYATLQSPSVTRETTLYVTVTDFAIHITPNSKTIFAGLQATYNISLAVAPGFSAPIQIRVLNPPAGTKAQVLSTGILYGPGAGNDVLQISTTAATRPGTYTLTVDVTATLDTGDYIVHSQTIQLTVR